MGRYRILLALVAATTLAPAAADACPFCPAMGQTLTLEVNQASFVVFGTLSNPRFGGDGDGTTDLAIEEVVKDHPFLKGKKNITLPRYLPVDPNRKLKYMVFVDLFKEQLDPYRGIPSKDGEIVKYLAGATKVKDSDVAARLQFFFNYLDHGDVEISTDAYKEFANADYKDVMKMLDAAKKEKKQGEITQRLVKWLKDKETPSYRYGLYGYLLGASGNDTEAGVLIELLEDPERGLVSGVDGVLAGYIRLKPQEGWKYLEDIVKNSKNDFQRRYAALRTLRYLWEYGGERTPPKQVLAAMAPLLEQEDISDLAIGDLRKWKQWLFTKQILGLYGRDSHNIPIIRKAIIAYALSCPADQKDAVEFVKEQRRLQPQTVTDVEELLKFEMPPEPPKDPKKPDK